MTKYYPLKHVKKSAEKFYYYTKLIKSEDAFWAQRVAFRNLCLKEIRMYGNDYRNQVLLKQTKKSLKNFDKQIKVTFAEARRRLRAQGRYRKQ